MTNFSGVSLMFFVEGKICFVILEVSDLRIFFSNACYKAFYFLEHISLVLGPQLYCSSWVPEFFEDTLSP